MMLKADQQRMKDTKAPFWAWVLDSGLPVSNDIIGWSSFGWSKKETWNFRPRHLPGEMQDVCG